MKQKDADFLMWIAKRLVYKYKENPDIINLVQNIINDNTLDESIYKNLFIDIHSYINELTENLLEKNQIFLQSFENLEKITIKSTNTELDLDLSFKNNLFENLDISKLYK